MQGVVGLIMYWSSFQHVMRHQHTWLRTDFDTVCIFLNKAEIHLPRRWKASEAACRRFCMLSASSDGPWWNCWYDGRLSLWPIHFECGTGPHHCPFIQHAILLLQAACGRQHPRWHKFPSLSSYVYSESSPPVSLYLSLLLSLSVALLPPAAATAACLSQANQNSSANHHPIGWKLKRGKGLLVCFERLVHLKHPEGVCKCLRLSMSAWERESLNEQ